MKSIWMILALLISMPAFANDPSTESEKAAKKAAKEKRKEIEKRMKKYGFTEVEGERIIGISDPYYIISGKKVPCDMVEFKCQNGRCVMVLKK